MGDRPIVYLTPYYPPFGAGGAEFTTSLHARLLAQLGCKVLVITPNFGAAAQETDGGVEIFRFPFRRLDGTGQQLSAGTYDNPRYQRYVAQQTIKILRDFVPKCLHFQNSQAAIAGNMVAQALNVPLIGHVRDTSMICNLGAICQISQQPRQLPSSCGAVQHAICAASIKQDIYATDAGMLRRAGTSLKSVATYPFLTWRRNAYSKAWRIAFASHGLRDMYEQIDGFRDRQRNRVVYAPVLESPMQLPTEPELPQVLRRLKDSGSPIVLYVGKISKGKGVDTLIAAHKRLLQRMPDVHLVVAGNLHDSEWGFDRERTVTLGFVERRSVERLYALCDLVVVPSTWPEPLGWATLDAARHGKPIVATRVGGIPEAVIHEKTGLLVEKLDAEAMASAMAKLLEDRELARQFGENAKAHVRTRFGAAAVGGQLTDLYEGL